MKTLDFKLSGRLLAVTITSIIAFLIMLITSNVLANGNDDYKPTPTPTQTPTPTPASTQTPTPTQTTTPVVHNTQVVDVNQNQSQKQSQEQNNNQKQNVETSANASGGSGSSTSSSSSNSSANVTIGNNATPYPTATPTTETRVVYVDEGRKVTYVPQSNPQVLAQAPSNVKELPKTGLPLAAIAFASLLPAGALIKKLGMKKDTIDESNPNTIWMKRNFE